MAACPSLMCSFNRGNIEGTNSSKAAHTTYQLSSPSCSTRAIQKSLNLVVVVVVGRGEVRQGRGGGVGVGGIRRLELRRKWR